MAAPRHGIAPGRRAGHGAELELSAVHPRPRLAVLLLRTPGAPRRGWSDRDGSAAPSELSPPPPLGAAARGADRRPDAGCSRAPRRADARRGTALDRPGAPRHTPAFGGQQAGVRAVHRSVGRPPPGPATQLW